jgi:hypothetical protein
MFAFPSCQAYNESVMTSLFFAIFFYLLCGLDFLWPVPQVFFALCLVCAVPEAIVFFISLIPSGSSRPR